MAANLALKREDNKKVYKNFCSGNAEVIFLCKMRSRNFHVCFIFISQLFLSNFFLPHEISRSENPDFVGIISRGKLFRIPLNKGVNPLVRREDDVSVNKGACSLVGSEEVIFLACRLVNS